VSQQTDLKMRALNAGLWVTAVLSEAAEKVALRLEDANSWFCDRAADYHYMTFGPGYKPIWDEVARFRAMSPTVQGEVTAAANAVAEEINKFFATNPRPPR
jgi:hypothetical protein